MKDSQDMYKEKNVDESQKSRGDKIKSAIGEIFIYAAIFILCLFLVPEFICCKYTVEGKSMESTLKNGQQLIGEKVSYVFTDPKRFDVVVVQPYEGQKDNYYVKRVIGLPGETVEIKGSVLLINGKVMSDPYINEPMWDTTKYGPLTLGKDEYLVMGDNRNYSIDSRDDSIGPIPKDRFIAKVFLRVWPLEKLSLIH